MGGVLHGSARTTSRLRAEFRASKEAQPSPCRPLQHRPENRAEVAQAGHNHGRADGAVRGGDKPSHWGVGVVPSAAGESLASW